MADDSAELSDEDMQRAADWLARRDRGLSASEQDRYLEWLRADPRRGRAMAELEAAWGTLDQLSALRPAHSGKPDPNLLAPRRHWQWRFFPPLACAAAVAVALGVVFFQTAREEPHRDAPTHQAIIHPAPERLTLADGSRVDLNTGAKIETDFTAAERRVRLLQGEAHFAVEKDAGRPFIVTVGQVSVRAIGTAFSVALSPAEVSVLVTEGRVRLDAAPSTADVHAAVTRELAPVVAGQRATIGLGEMNDLRPHVREVTPAELERALAWQALRLEFLEMPLRDVAATFNRYNQRKLVVIGDDTAALLVGGSFRADNLDAFVRLLESSFGITVTQRGDDFVLQKHP